MYSRQVAKLKGGYHGYHGIYSLGQKIILYPGRWSQVGPFYIFIYISHVYVYVVVDASGWWKGRFKGREGLFPNNYIEKL